MIIASNARVKTTFASLFAGLLILACTNTQAAELGPFKVDGSIEVEHRLFIDDSPFKDFSAEVDIGNNQTSARLLAEFFTEWNDGNDRFVFEPFAR